MCQQEKQDRDWKLSAKQTPGAVKRLGQRVRRKVKNAVRRMKGAGEGDDDGSSSDEEQISPGSDCDGASESDDSQVGSPPYHSRAAPPMFALADLLIVHKRRCTSSTFVQMGSRSENADHH